MNVLIETLNTAVLHIGPDGWVGTTLTGQEGDPATVTVNDTPVTYPVTLAAGDVLRIDRTAGTITTRLLGTEAGGPGQAGTVTVGTVTTLPPGSAATVTNTGTATAAVLDFGIPRGVDGDPGPGGANGADGAAGADGVSVTDAEINGSGHLILTLSNGATIDAGAVGGGGTGLPAGGTTGQVLTKLSATDGDATWVTPATGESADLAALPGYDAGSVQTLQTDGAGGFLWVTAPITWTYTYGTPPSGGYTDPSYTKLTDGAVGDLGSYGPAWVGWQSADPDIRLLASLAHNPGALDLHLLGDVGGGVMLPAQVTAYRSSDGGATWTQAGQVAVTAAGWTSVPVTGVSRYWRLVVTRAQPDAWSMASQFRVP